MALNTVTSIKGTPPAWAESEKNFGAHYYAFSPALSKSTYFEAYTNVVLPTSFRNVPLTGGDTNYTRNAYISLGISGIMGIDLGLKKNSDRNWYPFCFDSYEKQYGNPNICFKEYYSDCIAPADTTNAVIIVRPVSTTKVHMYVQFRDINGTDVGTFDQDIDVKAGNLTGSDCQYYRFASMVTDYANQNSTDSTFMLGGQFTGLGLYNSSTSAYESWGINTNLIQTAWEVSTPRMALTYYTNSEAFTIDNWA